MSDSVILKSNKYGLTLNLDPTIAFEDLVRDICKKFASSREFFGSTTMVLETAGRELTNEECLVIIQAIELNSDIKISLIHENNEYKDARMKGQIDRFYTDEIFENAKIIRGSIINEDTEISDSSVIVLGDVKSKASITARGNIIVLGNLTGKAHAGYPSNTGAYIVAGQLNSDKLTIGTVSGGITVQEKWSFRVKKTQETTMAVCVWNGELLAEPISSGMLKRINK